METSNTDSSSINDINKRIHSKTRINNTNSDTSNKHTDPNVMSHASDNGNIHTISDTIIIDNINNINSVKNIIDINYMNSINPWVTENETCFGQGPVDDQNELAYSYNIGLLYILSFQG